MSRRLWLSSSAKMAWYFRRVFFRIGYLRLVFGTSYKLTPAVFCGAKVGRMCGVRCQIKVHNCKCSCALLFDNVQPPTMIPPMEAQPGK